MLGALLSFLSAAFFGFNAVMMRRILCSSVFVAALLVTPPSIAGEKPSLPEIAGGDVEQLGWTA